MKGEYETGRIPMKSGISEVYNRIFKKVQGKSGKTWFIAIQKNPADNIYVFNPNDKGKVMRGFGGRKMRFKLEDGTIEEVDAPWHSNSDALFDDTGIDVKNMHLTKVVLCLGGVEYQGGHSWKMRNVIYKENEHKLGSFNRGEELAQEYANKLGKRVYYWIESMGGARGHFKDPEKRGDQK